MSKKPAPAPPKPRPKPGEKLNRRLGDPFSGKITSSRSRRSRRRCSSPLQLHSTARKILPHSLIPIRLPFLRQTDELSFEEGDTLYILDKVLRRTRLKCLSLIARCVEHTREGLVEGKVWGSCWPYTCQLQ